MPTPRRSLQDQRELPTQEIRTPAKTNAVAMSGSCWGDMLELVTPKAGAGAQGTDGRSCRQLYMIGWGDVQHAFFTQLVKSEPLQGGSRPAMLGTDKSAGVPYKDEDKRSCTCCACLSFTSRHRRPA